MWNTSISEAEIEEVSGENRVNFANREFLISKEMMGRSGWYFKKWRQPNKDDCSCIIGAGFNGGALCSFNRMKQYVDYLEIFPPIPKSLKAIGGRNIICF